jgi:Asp-tRNA(Asn)/Glu-tRNA(Gln) amidotransferase C subunit
MTEEDLFGLVKSIDENDIEIITSNDSETNDQLEFLLDHFSIDNKNVNPPFVPIQTTSLIREDSEVSFSKKKILSKSSLKEFEDKTLIERLYGLTEIFPNWLQMLFQNSYQYSKYVGQFIKKSIWFCSSSFIILILPILVQLEFSQVAEMQVAQTRQVKSPTTK